MRVDGTDVLSLRAGPCRGLEVGRYDVAGYVNVGRDRASAGCGLAYVGFRNIGGGVWYKLRLTRGVLGDPASAESLAFRASPFAEDPHTTKSSPLNEQARVFVC